MGDNHELSLLLNRVFEGDVYALESLLLKIRPYLHLLVRRQLDPDLRHKFGDSDIVQETLIKVHKSLKSGALVENGHFHGQSPPEFLGWVSQIVRNLIVDLQRRGNAQKRDGKREISGSKILASLICGRTPEEGVDRDEKAVQFAAALARLPQHQREVLEWRVFEQLSFSDISARMNKSEGALRVLAKRAIAALSTDVQLRQIMEVSS